MEENRLPWLVECHTKLNIDNLIFSCTTLKPGCTKVRSCCKRIYVEGDDSMSGAFNSSNLALTS